MLKSSSIKSAKTRKGVVGVGGDSRAGYDKGELNRNGIDDVEVDGGEFRDDEIGKKGRKETSKNLSKSKNTVG